MELDAFGVQFGDEVDELFDAAPEAVKFPHDERVTRSQYVQRFGQSRAFGAGSRDGVLEDSLTSRMGEGFTLKVKALFRGGNSRVSSALSPCVTAAVASA